MLFRSPALLFDTNALIDIYRGRETMRARFQDVVAGQLTAHLSVITEAELWRGIHPEDTDRHEAILSYFRLIPLYSAMARLAGKWMRKYEAQGLGWMDALIVATAKQKGLDVLTRDTRLVKVLASETQFEVYVVT